VWLRVGREGQMTERGPLFTCIDCAPVLDWLLRGRVQSLALHEGGIVVERGRGKDFVPWSSVERVIAADAGAAGLYELGWGGDTIKLSAETRGVRDAMQLAASRAGLEWIVMRAGGRRLPPMAIRPQLAANLRASGAVEDT